MSWLLLRGAIALFIFFDAKARQEESWLTEKFPDYANYRHSINS